MIGEEIITVRDLTKVYRVYRHPLDPLKELALGRPRHRKLRALEDVAFSVNRGERLGIIGRNGAGKSTLLKVLASTVNHTSGTFRINGPLRAILELGTGFHDEYSGRNNIFFSGLCIGYTRAELKDRTDWIIDFAELRHVIDQPVRTYSSGMKQRLMFAVAFCKPTEVMIIDEALATGDASFVRKCTKHISDLCRGGSTVLAVSHNLYFIERFCTRVLYLRDGRLAGDGPPAAMIRRYERDLGLDYVESIRGDPASGSADGLAPTNEPPADVPERVPPNGEGSILDDDGRWQPFDFSGAPSVRQLGLVTLRKAEILDEAGFAVTELKTGRSVRIRLELESRVRKDDVHVGVMIWNDENLHVATTTNVTSLGTGGVPNGVRVNLTDGILVVEVSFPSLQLGSGRYHLTLGVAPGPQHFSDDDLLLHEKKCLAFWVSRPDIAQYTVYEPESIWTAPKKIDELPAGPTQTTPEPDVHVRHRGHP